MRLRVLVFILIALCVFAAHFLSRNSISLDSRWYLYMSMSLIREGNLDLDEYRELIEKQESKAVRDIDGHLYCIFPIGTPLLAVPFVLAADTFYKRTLNIDLNEVMRYVIPRGLETFIASIIVGFTAAVIYLIAMMHLRDVLRALILAFIFAFCTSAWSTASRALWQHGPSMLFLSLSLCLILSGKRRPGLVRFAGLTLAIACVIRPTNGIPLALLTVYVAMEHRKELVRFLLFGLAVAVPFVLFNLSVYDRLLSPYYAPERLVSNPDFLEALAGNLVSPARGLFVFSPILLFSIYGIVLKSRRGAFRRLDGFLSATLVLHWLAISSFRHWWGGHCFGPRFFTDMLPFFLYFLVPVLERAPERKAAARFFLASGFLLCAAASFFIHFQGANNHATHVWNYDPATVDADPSRLWDWHDIQFLKNGV